jgi:hypothetical protein
MLTYLIGDGLEAAYFAENLHILTVADLISVR